MNEIADKLPTKEQFADYLNSDFAARFEGGEPYNFHLIEVKGLISNSVQESFSLSFRAPSNVPAVQNLFQIEHQKLGTMSLLLVPYKQDRDGLYFDATFNHLVQ